MLYLNNPLLNKDTIISEFKQKVLDAGSPRHPNAPSVLKQFQNKLRSVYFKGREKEQRLAALLNEPKFNIYPELKEVLHIILSLEDGKDLSKAAEALNNVVGVEWGVPDLDTHWDGLEKQYGYFTHLSPEQRESYKTCFKQLTQSCRKMAVLLEENNTPEDTMAYEYAYKLMVLYATPENDRQPGKLFDNVAKNTHKLLNQVDVKSNKPFHDVLLVQLQLPKKEDVSDMPGWHKLINQVRNRAFPFFASAKKIESKIADTTGGELRAPKNLSEANHIFIQCSYERAHEDLVFSTLCHQYKVSEETFNRCLEYMAEPPGWPKKIADNIPVVDIQGVGGSARYRLQKLPVDDKRALILGEITDCCQSINGDSEQCVKDGVTLSDNGFYVILKEDKKGNTQIIGQAYAWKTKSGSLCLDSIECLINSISVQQLREILSSFARQVLIEHPDIKVITLGQGGKTPEKIFPPAILAESMNQGRQYNDSRSQYFIMGQAELRENYSPLPSDIAPSEMMPLLEYLRNYFPSDNDKASVFREFLVGNVHADIQTAFTSAINSFDDLYLWVTLAPLTSEQFISVIQCVEAKLPELFNDYNGMKLKFWESCLDLMKNLQPEQCVEVCKNLKVILVKSLIAYSGTPEDYDHIWLSRLVTNILLTYQFGVHFFQALLPELPEDQVEYVVPGIDNSVLIPNVVHMLDNLPHEAAKNIYQELKKQLPKGYALEYYITSPGIEPSIVKKIKSILDESANDQALDDRASSSSFRSGPR